MSILDRFTEKEQALLKARAERIARVADDENTTDVIYALTVKIQNESYALPVDTLIGVYEEIHVVPVPCTPDYVAGIANVRGRVVPVFELASLLNLPGSEEEELSTLIVASNEDLTLAFRVVAIGDMLTIVGDEVGAVQAGSEINYVQGVLNDGTAVVNMSMILDDPRLVVNSSVSG